ncbi:hypothetical protein N7489_005385 [Penicillium chrysogenum]|uniref:uncharacterized protein n=1 Tax=Penicillium chrysogenum TaxID=5076 RepID=UPI0024DF1804|nr:uncharacterized protein N7489_005385 [Penicillium chrysogenum]KAJ5245289.1 hypothetical protein N7489_005385 [Penicillium chrysogenum]
MSELGNGLLDFPGWGYVIYRTTYSSESDALFPRTVRYIDVHIKQGFLAQRSRSPISAETICAKLLSTTVEDRNLTGRLSMRFAWVDYQGISAEHVEQQELDNELRYVKGLEAWLIVDLETFPVDEALDMCTIWSVDDDGRWR